MNKKKAWYANGLYGLAGFLALIFVWWLAAYLLNRQGNRLLPYPTAVGGALGDILFGSKASATYSGVGWTLARFLLGFVASFLLGGLLGTGAGLHPAIRSFLAPWVGLSRSVPTAAVVLILVGILASYTGWPVYIPVFLVFLIAFPIVYEAFRSGIEAEPSEEVDALKLDGAAKTWSGVSRVYWPDSLPFVLLSLLQSLGLSLKVSVMSEILINVSSANGGIGGLIQGAWLYLEMPYMVAYSLLAIILIALVDIPLHFAKVKITQTVEG